MRFRIALGAVLVMMLSAVAATGIASAAPGNNYTCTGGSIPGGNYASITVTGFCDIVPEAVINVSGNINVAPGALLDAQSAPSTITVEQNITAGAGSLLGLGCQPSNTIRRFEGTACRGRIAAPTVAAASGPPTGALHRIPGRSACISPATVASPCRHARHLQPTMLMSPDGRNVYT